MNKINKEIDAEQFLNSKGIYSLDTKNRTKEVIQWMEDYAVLRISVVGELLPTRDDLIKIVNNVVDETQCLGADNIVDGIIKACKRNDR